MYIEKTNCNRREIEITNNLSEETSYTVCYACNDLILYPSRLSNLYYVMLVYF